MIGDTRFDTFGLLKPDCVELNTARPEIYTRQYREAASITEYFERTPVQILADDVGTGKTWVAMMALFAKLNEGTKDQTKTRHALVVAPTRLVAEKWERELYQFNRNFVADPGKTVINRIASLKDLLEIINEGILMSSVLSVADTFRSRNTDKRLRTTNAAPILLLHILDAYAALLPRKKYAADYAQLREPLKHLKAKYQKRDDSSTRRLFAAALPQRKIAKVIHSLRVYVNACSSKDGEWYLHDFDAETWEQNKNRRPCGWNTLAKYLVKLLTIKSADRLTADTVEPKPVDIVVLHPKLAKRLNHLVQIISVLWSVDQRSAKISDHPDISEKTESELRSKLLTRAPVDVLRTIVTLLDQGLPKAAKTCIEENCDNKSFSDLLAPYDIKADTLSNTKETIESTEVERIVCMLGAFAARVGNLCGAPIEINHPFMNRYSAASVFENSTDLFKSIESVKKDDYWEPLAKLLCPLFKVKQLKGKALLNLMPVAERLAAVILQLIDYQVHPERVGSTFWTEKPKKRAIHVIRMNDLKVVRKKGKSKKSKEDAALPDADIESVPSDPISKKSQEELIVEELAKTLGSKRPIEIAVIDEAHNWKRQKRGAPDYRKFVQQCVQRTLQVTATPVHMSVNDLKTIINLGHCSKEASSYPRFVESYNALFADEKGKHLLSEAAKRQKKVADCWMRLAGNKEALDLIKTSQKRLDHLQNGSDIRSEQLNEWNSLKELANKPSTQPLRDLAKAVQELRQFQVDQLLSHLRRLIVKTRTEKHITGDDGRIGTRRYMCGHECSIEALDNWGRPPADDTHLLFHNARGVEQGGNSWVDLIGMRLSQLPLNESDQKQNARLMVGLPSSYAALADSALLQDVQNKKKEDRVDNRPEITRLYANVFENCTTASESSHPKISKTADIVFENLMRGQKTLVFCQRIATVKVLSNLIRTKIDDCLRNRIGELRAISPKDDPDEVIKRVFESAWALARELFGDSELTRDKKKFNAFKELVIKNSGGKSLAAGYYDARVVWLVNEILTAMPSPNAGSAKAKKQIQQRLRVQEYDYESGQALESEKEEDPPVSEKEHEQPGQPQTESTNRSEMKLLQEVIGETTNRDTILANFSSPFFPLVLICSQVSQEGVDMHRYCRTIVLHDLNWNPAILEQRIGRLDRVGSFASELKLPVDVFVPFLADSYDEYQYHRVLQRAELQELLFGRNDKNICDKELNDTNDEHNVESNDADVPLLGNLIYGLFDMDLSAESRSDEK